MSSTPSSSSSSSSSSRNGHRKNDHKRNPIQNHVVSKGFGWRMMHMMISDYVEATTSEEVYLVLKVYKKPKIDPKLVDLRLSGRRLGDDQLQLLSEALHRRCDEVGASDMLKSLGLAQNRFQCAGVTSLAKTLDQKGPQLALRVLDVSKNALTDEGVLALTRVLVPLGQAQLTCLNISTTRMGAESICTLGEILASTGCLLEDLDVSENSLGDSNLALLLNSLSANASLRSLSVNGNSLGLLSASAMQAMLQNNRTLVRLNAVSTSVGPEAIALIASGLASNTALKEISLARNPLYDRGVMHLAAALRTNATLQSLGLWSTKMESPGAESLVDALQSGCPSLTDLNITLNAIPKATLISLHRLMKRNHDAQVSKGPNLSPSSLQNSPIGLPTTTTTSSSTIRGRRKKERKVNEDGSKKERKSMESKCLETEEKKEDECMIPSKKRLDGEFKGYEENEEDILEDDDDEKMDEEEEEEEEEMEDELEKNGQALFINLMSERNRFDQLQQMVQKHRWHRPEVQEIRWQTVESMEPFLRLQKILWKEGESASSEILSERDRLCEQLKDELHHRITAWRTDTTECQWNALQSALESEPMDYDAPQSSPPSDDWMETVDQMVQLMQRIQHLSLLWAQESREAFQRYTQVLDAQGFLEAGKLLHRWTALHRLEWALLSGHRIPRSDWRTIRAEDEDLHGYDVAVQQWRRANETVRLDEQVRWVEHWRELQQRMLAQDQLERLQEIRGRVEWAQTLLDRLQAQQDGPSRLESLKASVRQHESAKRRLAAARSALEAEEHDDPGSAESEEARAKVRLEEDRYWKAQTQVREAAEAARGAVGMLGRPELRNRAGWGRMGDDEDDLYMADGSRLGYEFVRELGGGRSRVDLVRKRTDACEDRFLVLKHFEVGQSVDRRRLFERELAVLRKLRGCAHVAQVLGYFVEVEERTGEVATLVLTYYPGGSLEEWLRQPQHARPWDDRLRLSWQMLRGLEELHRLKVVHGDLKPANVLLDHDGAAILADFDLAKDERQLYSVSLVGNLECMAPELFNKDAARTSASDVYALGCVLLRLHYPEYDAPSSLDVSNGRQTVQWRRPGHLDRPIDAVLERMLAVDPALRPTAYQLTQDPAFAPVGVDTPVLPAPRPVYWTTSGLPMNLASVDGSEEVVREIERLMNAGERKAAGPRTRGVSAFEVVSVQRVENASLWEMYRACHVTAPKRPEEVRCHSGLLNELLGIRHALGEQLLFHGTNHAALAAVMPFGLDEKVAAGVGLYGSGIYFAEDAFKSDAYTTEHNGLRVMLLTRVHLGLSYHTAHKLQYLRRPPCLNECKESKCPGHVAEDRDRDSLKVKSHSWSCDSGVPCLRNRCPTTPHPRYDSVIAEVPLRAREFIVYNKSQVYVEFVIMYRDRKTFS